MEWHTYERKIRGNPVVIGITRNLQMWCAPAGTPPVQVWPPPDPWAYLGVWDTSRKQLVR